MQQPLDPYEQKPKTSAPADAPAPPPVPRHAQGGLASQRPEATIGVPDPVPVPSTPLPPNEPREAIVPPSLGGPEVPMPADVDLSDPNLSTEDYERALPAIKAKQDTLRQQQRNQEKVAALDAQKAKREADNAAFYGGRSRASMPEYAQADDPRVAPEVPTGPTGPSEQDALMGIADKGDRREEEKRSNALATERARQRRGLPPLPGNEQARAAVEGGGDGMRSYRESGPQEASGPPAAGYVTGQEVQLEGMPGGQTSTKVYALGGGVSLPDSQGMGNEDFMAAFKQLNPGKSPVDAIRGLSREPGAKGAAARKILRDAGASGGTALSAAQKQQVEQALGGQAATMLRDHARSMNEGIEGSSRQLLKDQEDARQKSIRDQEDLDKEESSIRTSAIAKAEKRFNSGEEAGLSREKILEEEVKMERERRDFASGKTESISFRGPKGEGAMDVSSSNANPERIPAGAMPKEASRKPDGSLQFQPEGFPRPLPAVLIESQGVAEGGEVVPVVTNPREIKALPVGQGYMLDGKYYSGRGQPGRPSESGSSTGSSRGSSGGTQKEGSIANDFQRIRTDLIKEQEKAIEASHPNLMAEISTARSMVEQNPGDSGALQNLNEKEQKLAALKADSAVNNAAIETRYNEEQQLATEASEFESEMLFRQGDPETFKARADNAYKEPPEIVNTRAGQVMSINGQDIPIEMAGDTPIVNPTSAAQIEAIEANSNGNVFSASMGADAQAIVGGETYKKTTELRQSLVDQAKEMPFIGLNPRMATKVLEDARSYIDAKYPNLDEMERDGAVDAILESAGFKSGQPSKEEVDAMQENMGFDSAENETVGSLKSENSEIKQFGDPFQQLEKSTKKVESTNNLREYEANQDTVFGRIAQLIPGAGADFEVDPNEAYRQAEEDYAFEAYMNAPKGTDPTENALKAREFFRGRMKEAGKFPSLPSAPSTANDPYAPEETEADFRGMRGDDSQQLEETNSKASEIDQDIKTLERQLEEEPVFEQDLLGGLAQVGQTVRSGIAGSGARGRKRIPAGINKEEEKAMRGQLDALKRSRKSIQTQQDQINKRLNRQAVKDVDESGVLDDYPSKT